MALEGTGIQLPNIGINASWVSGIFMTILLIIFYIVIAILIVSIFVGYWYFFIYRKKLYTTDCILFVKRQQGSPVIAFDKGGFITKKKMSRFRLLKRKDARVNPPKYEQLIMNEAGRNTLLLYKYGEIDYSVLNVNIDETNKDVKLIPIEGLSKDAVIQDIRELIVDLSKPSLFEKWAVPLTLIGAVIIIMAGTYFMVALLAKQIATSSSAYLQGAQVYKEAVDSLANALGVIRGTT